MKWPWRDADRDGAPDDYPIDTYNEMFLAWIALMLTGIFIFVVLGYVSG